MNILFVTLYAIECNTSVTKSNYGLIKGLLEAGHEITILMPDIDADLPYYDSSYSLDNLGSRVVRIKNNGMGPQIAKITNNSSGIKKTVLLFGRKLYYKFKIFDKSKELLDEVTKIKSLDDYYDIIISTSDPKASHLFVKGLVDHGLKYRRWIQHWGDPLVGDIASNSIYPKYLLKRIEKKIIKWADSVVYVSPFTLNEQKKRYPSISHKMHFVPLPCDLIDNTCESEKIKTKNVLNIAYLGDYNFSVRNIMPLYASCKNLDFIHLTIAGNSDLNLEESNVVKILPRVSQAKAKELESLADVIVSVGNRNGTQIPGKIYYSAASNKPILVILDGNLKQEMKAYFDSFDRFICCYNTEESIKNALKMIYLDSTKTYKTPNLLIPVNVAKNVISE